MALIFKARIKLRISYSEKAWSKAMTGSSERDTRSFRYPSSIADIEIKILMTYFSAFIVNMSPI